MVRCMTVFFNSILQVLLFDLSETKQKDGHLLAELFFWTGWTSPPILVHFFLQNLKMVCMMYSY